MNRADAHLDEAVKHMRRAKLSLECAAVAVSKAKCGVYGAATEEMIGLIPRLNDLTADTMGAVRAAKECEP